jgi:hypothetical protein
VLVKSGAGAVVLLRTKLQRALSQEALEVLVLVVLAESHQSYPQHRLLVSSLLEAVALDI